MNGRARMRTRPAHRISCRSTIPSRPAGSLHCGYALRPNSPHGAIKPGRAAARREAFQRDVLLGDAAGGYGAGDPEASSGRICCLPRPVVVRQERSGEFRDSKQIDGVTLPIEREPAARPAGRSVVPARAGGRREFIERDAGSPRRRGRRRRRRRNLGIDRRSPRGARCTKQQVERLHPSREASWPRPCRLRWAGDRQGRFVGRHFSGWSMSGPRVV